jgi:hypothetical protein
MGGVFALHNSILADTRSGMMCDPVAQCERIHGWCTLVRHAGSATWFGTRGVEASVCRERACGHGATALTLHAEGTEEEPVERGYRAKDILVVLGATSWLNAGWKNATMGCAAWGARFGTWSPYFLAQRSQNQAPRWEGRKNG